MPYVRVDILEGLSTAQKLAIHKGITDLLVKVAGKNPDYTFIAINEVPDENWAERSQASVGAVRVRDITVAPPWDSAATTAQTPLVIVIDEVDTDNWGFRGTSVTELRKLAGPKAVASKVRKT